MGHEIVDQNGVSVSIQEALVVLRLETDPRFRMRVRAEAAMRADKDPPCPA